MSAHPPKRKLSSGGSESPEKKHRENPDAKDPLFDVEDHDLDQRGYDSAIFCDQATLTSMKDECSICFKVAHKAHMTSCRHLFCQLCIERSLSIKKSCPTCRTPAVSAQPSWSSQTRIDDYLVTCVLNEEKAVLPSNKILAAPCAWKGPRKLLQDHVQTDCPLCRLRCKKCKQVVQRVHWEEHLRVGCPFRPVACHQCHALVPFNALSHHVDRQCSMAMVDCPNKCDEQKRTRVDLRDTHLNVCPNAVIECFCGEHVLRSIFESTHFLSPASFALHLKSIIPLQAQVLSLTQSQDQLQTRVHELEGQLKIVSGNLEARSRHRGRFLPRATGGWDVTALQVGDLVDVMDRDQNGWFLAEVVSKIAESKCLDIAIAGYTAGERSLIKNYFDSDTVAPAFSRCFKTPLTVLPFRVVRFGEREFGKDNDILRFSELSMSGFGSGSSGIGSSGFDSAVLELLRSEGTPMLMLQHHRLHDVGGWTCCGAPIRSARGCCLR